MKLKYTVETIPSTLDEFGEVTTPDGCVLLALTPCSYPHEDSRGNRFFLFVWRKIEGPALTDMPRYVKAEG